MSDYYADTLDALPLFRMARRTDPRTSHEAAAGAAGFAADHRRRIVEALRLSPAGATQIADRCGLDRAAVGKRTSELERDGVIVRCGTEFNRRGKRETTYRLSGGNHGNGR
jgi:DNA-binding MarR family transcriptional regulator